ncbi:MAG: hypothetical protein EOO46_10785 [Flavobacterium sp.]|nr:MAG: hypothetical protein EOO46_10785 [Flavobacterium sp.]
MTNIKTLVYHINNQFEEKFAESSKALIESLGDFQFVYMLVSYNLKRNRYWISPSIRANLRRFNNYLLQGTPNSKLISTFRTHKSLDLLKQIGKSDLDFFIKHYPEVSDRLDGLYDFVINTHKKSSYGQAFLLSSLKDDSIHSEIKISIYKNLIWEPECFDKVLTELQHFVNAEKNLLYLDSVRKLLQPIPIEILQKVGLSQIYTFPNIIERRFTAEIQSDLEGQTILLKIYNTSISPSIVRRNIKNVFWNSKLLDCSFETTAVDHLNQLDTIVVEGHTDDIQNALREENKAGEFIVHFLEFKDQSRTLKIKYLRLIPTTASNRMHIVVESSVSKLLSNLHKPTRRINLIIASQYSFMLLNFTKYNSSYFLLSLRNLDLSDLKLAHGNIELLLLEVELDFTKPYSYHADILTEKDIFLRHIEANIKESLATQDFVKKIGISSFYQQHKEIDLKLMVMVYLRQHDNHWQARLYDIQSKRIIGLISYSDCSSILQNDIVILENPHLFRKADIATLPNDLFIESEIISIDFINKQGFIKDKNGVKDFYFLFNHCHFEPALGDMVRFIPGVNFHKDYHEMPFGYCISKLSQKTNKAEVYKYLPGADYVNLFLKDTQSDQTYFARVRSNEMFEIKNFTGAFDINQIFAFQILFLNTRNNQLPRVKLTELII